MCGCCLTGVTIEDSLFFLYGFSANGKSVFLRAVSGAVSDYHETAAMDMFTVTFSERHPTDLAMLPAPGWSPRSKPRKASDGTKANSKR